MSNILDLFRRWFEDDSRKKFLSTEDIFNAGVLAGTKRTMAMYDQNGIKYTNDKLASDIIILTVHMEAE